MPRQRGDPAQALKKIQRHALRGQNRAGRAANFQDRLTAGKRGSVRLEDIDIQFRVYPPENFRGGFSARDDGAFARNDSTEGPQPVGNKKLGRDVARADIFSQRDRDGVWFCFFHA